MKQQLLFVALVAVLLAAVVTSARLQAPLHVHDSLKTRLLRAQDWSGLEALSRLEKGRTSGLSTVPQSRFNVTQDGAIAVEILVGSNAQRMPVLLNMRSPTTWLVNPNCDATGCADVCRTASEFCTIICPPSCCPASSPSTAAPTTTQKRRLETAKWRNVAATLDGDDRGAKCNASTVYDHSKSTTYKPDGRDFIEYWRDERIYGKYANDKISLGYSIENHQPAFTSNVTFGEALEVPNDVLGGQFAGILGLGPGYNNENVESIIRLAYIQDVIDQDSLNFYLAKPGPKSAPAGVLTYGSSDDDHCYSTPLSANTNQDYNFNVTGYEIDGSFYTDNLRAAVDLGVEELVADQNIIDIIAKSAGAEYNETFNVYFVDCKREIDVKIWLSTSKSNGDKLIMTQHELIAHPAPTLCVLNVKPSTAEQTNLVFGRMLARKYCITQYFGSGILRFYSVIE